MAGHAEGSQSLFPPPPASVLHHTAVAASKHHERTNMLAHILAQFLATKLAETVFSELFQCSQLHSCWIMVRDHYLDSMSRLHNAQKV